VKAVDWSYEREWRLVGGRDETTITEDFAFHPDEVSAIYLGCRISAADKQAIINVVANKYPHATIYVGRKSERRFAVEFAPLQLS
jgi:UDP-N-acetylmuramate-alanine ligase